MAPSSSSRASAPSLQPSSLQSRPIIQPDGRGIEAGDDEEDNDEEYEDEDDEQLTLAQGVVKEWSVENVCLWLHEDVGVPGVVLRFQQKQCNGEMLLELTESDLINDFGVKDRVQRERILSAIEAINTSNAFSDEDEDDDEDEISDEEDLEESEGYEATNTSTIRHSIGAAPVDHPRDILRRPPQPSPGRVLGGDLPSSNDMVN
ncbi:hypothetical protein DVH05_020598 [Phytophthora capsici]|nr:hypothetical protein DVH05_020598 [Phytophthora capsici]